MVIIIICLIGLFILSILLRLLRRNYRCIDWISYLIMSGVFIGVWINENFWWGLIAGIVAATVISIITGMGDTTVINRFGRKYTFECNECGFNDLDIIHDSGEVVETKCPRCGKRQVSRLNH